VTKSKSATPRKAVKPRKAALPSSTTSDEEWEAIFRESHAESMRRDKAYAALHTPQWSQKNSTDGYWGTGQSLS
jgi:hypothetical protein